MINKEKANKITQKALAGGLPLCVAKLLACQGALESDNFTSHVFLTNHNAFGYKRYVGSEFQKGAGVTSTEGDPYADYESFDKSIDELVAWIKRRVRKSQFPTDLTKIQTGDQYAHLLKQCGYYGGPEANYAKILNMYLKQLE